MLRCGSPNVAIPLPFVVMFDLRWMQRTVGQFRTNVKKMFTGYTSCDVLTGKLTAAPVVGSMKSAQ